MRKFVFSVLVGALLLTFGPTLQLRCAAAQSTKAPGYTSTANAEVDYFDTNLFLGLAYHRWACALDKNSIVTTNNTYQGFTGTQYCHQGWSWNSEDNSASQYLGCAAPAGSSATTLNGCTGETAGQWAVTNTAEAHQWTTISGYFSDAWFGLYYAAANYDYGLPLANYAGNDWHNYSHSVQSNYANNSTANIDSRDPSDALNHCSYNILTNCNSDCWIYDFSTRQGATVSTISPCF
jgi:hypothetical protein